MEIVQKKMSILQTFNFRTLPSPFIEKESKLVM